MSIYDQSLATPLRVYVSSTVLDLKAFRQTVIAAIRKLGDQHWVVACCEDYPAEDMFPAEKCLDDVARCDVYVGMFGFRYGYAPPEYGRSITELEYREAVARKKTIVIFLADEEAEIYPKYVDKGRDAKRIGKLREELRKAHLIDQFFKTPDEAARQVVIALNRISIKRPTKRPKTWKVPPSNKQFLDVHGILETLHAAPTAAQRVVLHGLPGVGKTQAAIAYIHRHQDDFTACFWVNAESRATALSEMETIARGLHLHVEHEPEQTVESLKTWFDHPDNAGWLLVLDNANEYDLVRWLVPTAGRGRVLITTNERTVRNFGDLPIDVETVTPAEGADALLHLAGWKCPCTEAVREAARSISHELGGLMLAIDQAAAYIAGGSTPELYLSLYRQRRAELLGRRGQGGLHESVTVTFQLAFEEIFKRDPAAADLLRLCAVLGPEAVPEEVVIDGARFFGDPLGPAAADDLVRHDTILAASRLLRYDPGSRTLSTHQLTHDVLHDAMAPQLKGTWTERAVLALDRVFPSVEFSNWTKIDRLLPHSIECGRNGIKTRVAITEAARLLHGCAYYLLHRGNYRESEVLFNECLTEQAAIFGLDHADTLKTRGQLSLLMSMKGKAKQTLELLKELLPQMERVIGPDDRDTMKVRSIEARCIGDAGDPKEALRLFQELRVRQEALLGPLHPDTLMTRNDIAFWTGDMGEVEKALGLFHELLPDVIRVQGPEHPDTFTVQDDIALWTARSGNFEEAFQHFSMMLPRVERLFGEDHPLTLRVILNIAYNEANIGRRSEALHRVLSVMKDVKRVLGDHPDVFKTRSYAAIWTYELGHTDEGLRLLRGVISDCECVLGHDHPITLTTQLGLARVMIESDHREQGRLLALDGLARASKRFGADSIHARRFRALGLAQK